MGAHRVADAHLAAALRYADRLPTEAQAELYEARGRECYLLGEYEVALAAYDAAVDCRRQLGDGKGEGELLARRSGPLSSLGRQPEAVAATRAGLAASEQFGPSPELAYAYAGMTSVHMLARELPEAVSWGDRAIALSEELGCQNHLSYALIQSGAALLMGGEDAGLDRMHRGIAIARQAGWDGDVCLGLSQIGSGAGEIRRYDLAVPALDQCIEWAREHEVGSSELYASAWLARCELELGRWDRAALLASHLLANPRCTGISRFTAVTVLGRLRARRGDPGVWSLLDDALAFAGSTNHLQRLWRSRRPGPRQRGWRVACLTRSSDSSRSMPWPNASPSRGW